MASPSPRSSAPTPGYAPAVLTNVTTGLTKLRLLHKAKGLAVTFRMGLTKVAFEVVLEGSCLFGFQ